MTKSYFPLWMYGQPPIQAFANGVKVATRSQVDPVSIEGWNEVFTGRELRDLKTWHWALLHEVDHDISPDAGQPPEQLLADCHMALQVLNPQGNFMSLCVREQAASHGSPLITRFERFQGTAWSRMSSIGTTPPPHTQLIVDGVIEILASGNARIVNPFRLFEHAMTSTNAYIRILLWVTALDGVLMAIKTENFVERLCALLGSEHLVFPEVSSIKRDLRVRDLAEDLFLLRSQIAHGSTIGRKFWEVRSDLSDVLPADIYGDRQRYIQLLEEAALSIFCATVQKILINDLLDKYRHASTWKLYLKSL